MQSASGCSLGQAVVLYDPHALAFMLECCRVCYRLGSGPALVLSIFLSSCLVGFYLLILPLSITVLGYTSPQLPFQHISKVFWPRHAVILRHSHSYLSIYFCRLAQGLATSNGRLASPLNGSNYLIT